MRTGVSPRYHFDERWTDLRLCLELDGYAKERDEYEMEQDRFVPIEPIIEGAEAVEDDLTKELRRSGLPDIKGIIQVLDGSASAFRNSDFNGCLNDARVALQTLATSIARERLPNHPGSFDETKWGQVIAYLRTSSFITQQQEHGLAGVFGLISPARTHQSGSTRRNSRDWAEASPSLSPTSLQNGSTRMKSDRFRTMRSHFTPLTLPPGRVVRCCSTSSEGPGA